MTIVRGFTVVIISAMLFGVIGGILGYLIALYSPGYYEVLFQIDDPLRVQQIGLTLGLTQGMFVGIGIALIIVICVTWYESRKLLRDIMVAERDEEQDDA